MSVRSSQWHLRMASVKNTVPMFVALDHSNYQSCYHEEARSSSNGSYTAGISGQFYHGVALDEEHEMLINKDMKRS